MKMRKIISVEDKEQKRRKRNLVIGIILVIVMFSSVIGYSMNSGEKNSDASEKIIYNDVEFVRDSGLWNTDVGNYRYSFRYNPKEIENVNKILSIESKLKPLNSYSNQPLYIYSDNIEAATEIYRNLFYQNKIVLRVQDACFEEECGENVPIKNCTNNFIIIREGNNTVMKQQENCVFIEGKNENLTALSDSFLFKIIGV